MEMMKFYYTNWKGQQALRSVQDPNLWYGESKYHKGEQWFIHAYDVEREDFRDFAVADILAFVENKGE